MALEQEPFWPIFVERLRAAVARLPAHLLREEDIRTCLRDTLLEADARYHDPADYLAEADRVDVHLRSTRDGSRCYAVELKLWHATLKHAGTHDRLRSASEDETASHLVDLRKLAQRSARGGAYFVSLTQAEVHPQAAGHRWAGGVPGPFGSTRAGANAEGQAVLAGLLDADAAGFVPVTLPALTIRRRKETVVLPPTDLELRVVERARWRSGGGEAWGCAFDFRVWEVRRAGVGVEPAPARVEEPRVAATVASRHHANPTLRDVEAWLALQSPVATFWDTGGHRGFGRLGLYDGALEPRKGGCTLVLRAGDPAARAAELAALGWTTRTDPDHRVKVTVPHDRVDRLHELGTLLGDWRPA